MKKYIVISQMICLLFLLLFIIGLLLPSGYVLRIFGIINTLHIFIIFIFLEFLSLFLYFIIKRRYKKLLWNTLFLPVLFVLFIFIGLDSPNNTYKLTLENFDRELLIENKSVLLSGSSKIYQVENCLIAKFVYDAGGDDGHCPLEDRDNYEIIYYENGIEIIYDFGNGGDDLVHLYFIFNNGNLEKVNSLD